MGDVNVGASVRSIVSAFTSGLDVFQRIREHRERKKTAKATRRTELQLAKSLEKGSVSVQREYETRYQAVGEQFARGDAAAQSTLAEILLKLNTGIASIIAAFIRHGQRKTPDSFHFDAKSLMDLSNTSQAETLHALEQLHSRMTRRPYAVDHMSNLAVGTRPDRKRHGSSEKPRKHRHHREGEKKSKRQPEIARVPIKESSSQTQLVIIRPRTRRTSSSSSFQSAKPQSGLSTAATTPCTSPMIPKEDPGTNSYFPSHQSPPLERAKPANPRHRHASPLPNPAPPQSYHHRSQTWPSHPKAQLSSRSPPLQNILETDPKEDVPLFSNQPWSHGDNHHEKYSRQPQHSPPPPSPHRRRSDKLTPSTYTYLTTSTKLGEIPMDRWAEPWDYEEMERMNALALSEGTYPAVGKEEAKSGKKGFWGRWRLKSKDEGRNRGWSLFSG